MCIPQPEDKVTGFVERSRNTEKERFYFRQMNELQELIEFSGVFMFTLNTSGESVAGTPHR